MNPYTRLSAAFLSEHPADAAYILEDFPAESVAKLLAAVAPTTSASVIDHFTPGFSASCLLAIDTVAVGQIFSQLLPELQITLLRQLSLEERGLLLDTLQPDVAASIQNLLPYPDGTAGALMEPALANVPEDLSIRSALKRIKRIRRGMKSYIYITNARRQLTGVLTLHEILSARSSLTIDQVMHRQVVYLKPDQLLQAVIDSPYWQEYHALPVTDENKVLLGVIRQNNLRRFQERSIRADPVSNSLRAILGVTELFSITANLLLSGLVTAGLSFTGKDARD